jgi:hypothetical protein
MAENESKYASLFSSNHVQQDSQVQSCWVLFKQNYFAPKQKKFDERMPN